MVEREQAWGSSFLLYPLGESHEGWPTGQSLILLSIVHKPYTGKADYASTTLHLASYRQGFHVQTPKTADWGLEGVWAQPKTHN